MPGSWLLHGPWGAFCFVAIFLGGLNWPGESGCCFRVSCGNLFFGVRITVCRPINPGHAQLPWSTCGQRWQRWPATGRRGWCHGGVGRSTGGATRGPVRRPVSCSPTIRRSSIPIRCRSSRGAALPNDDAVTVNFTSGHPSATACTPLCTRPPRPSPSTCGRDAARGGRPDVHHDRGVRHARGAAAGAARRPPGPQRDVSTARQTQVERVLVLV